MIKLTQEDRDQLNFHYNGYTVDESKGAETTVDGISAKHMTEVLPSGATAHLYYDCIADHVYVYKIT